MRKFKHFRNNCNSNLNFHAENSNVSEKVILYFYDSATLTQCVSHLKWIFGPRNVVLASQNLGIEILIFLIVLPLFNLRKKLQLQNH